MKKIFVNFFLPVLMVSLLFSCKKDTSGITFSPVLDANSSSIVLKSTIAAPITLDQANAANLLAGFSWTAAKFGYPAAITYSLQISPAGANFAANADTTVEIGLSQSLSKTFTTSEFNRELLKIVTIKAGVPANIEIRVKASVGDAATPIYSNVLSLKVTPYRDIIRYNYPSALWIAGNYQGWNPGAALQIVDMSATPGNNYEGYINFTDGSPHDFKFVKGDNWGAGDYGSPGPGKIGPGGSNVSIVGPAGVYLLRASTIANTYSATKINTWGIIGDATPNGWGNSTPMTFDASAGTWSITTNLSAGEMKFRANDDWGINFGDNNADNIPDYGGSNIKVAQAGNYTITLDLGLAGNYTYLLKKH